MRILFFFFLLLSAIKTNAQSGCTDNQAENYDPIAIENDGSCVYALTNHLLVPLAELPTTLAENSGLAWNGNELWTHNDGGNENKLYQIDTLTGAILREVVIASSTNVDWEDLAASDTHIYIGDFGNNDGNRMDLTIYQIAKSDLSNSIAIAEIITFSYEDQTDFSINNNGHNFDCEAFFYQNDSLHLFTKNWENRHTKHYVIPAQIGNHIAKNRGEFFVEGLITGADSDGEGTIGLCGYDTNGATFMWLLFDYKENNFFSGNKRRLETGTALSNSQTEAILFSEKGRGYVSAEGFQVLPARLLEFDIFQYLIPLTGVREIGKTFDVNVYPNPFDQEFSIRMGEIEAGNYQLRLFNLLGQIIWEKEQHLDSNSSFTIRPILPKGMYFLSLQKDGVGEIITIYKQ